MSALLEAICAAPDDDAPRLVYADQLLESNDEQEQERGHLIIAQCTVMRASRRSDEWRRARSLEKRLLRHLDRSELTAPAYAAHWKRGFPSYAQLGPRAFREQGLAIPRLPFTTFYFSDAGDHDVTLRDLALLRHTFPWLQTIMFHNATHGSLSIDARIAPFADDDDTLAWPDGDVPHPSLHPAITRFSLVKSPPLPLAPWLELDLPALDEMAFAGDSGAYIPELIARFGSVKGLWCSGMESRNSMRIMAGSGALARLDRLTAEVEIHPDLIAALASSSIRDLELRYQPSLGLRAMAPMIAPHVERLNLGCLTIDKQPIAALADARFDALDTLELHRFHLDAATERLDMPALVELELKDCTVDERAGVSLIRRGL